MPAERVLIQGGEVVDGTGAEPTRADLLIEADRIVHLARSIPATDARVIDATGLYVAPGFINIHGHSDLSAITCPEAQNRLYDGVTTEVSGQCGHSLFPVVGQARRYLQPDLEGKGVEVSWSDFAGYAERVEEARPAINHIFFVGHGTLRAAVVGLEDRPPTGVELARMRRLLEEALEQGAFGLSTGLIYPPGCYAREDELAELAAVCATLDPPALYASHQRNEGNHIEESLAEFLAVLRKSGAPGQLSHVKISRPANWHKISWLEDQLNRARKQGLALTGDRYPYTASSTGLSRDLPAWLHDGGREAFLARIARPEVRRRIAEEMAITDPADHWQRVVIVHSRCPSHRPYLGRSVYEVARSRGGEPLEVALDLLLEAQGRIEAVFHRMDEGNLRRILTWSFIAVGSDSRIHPPVDRPSPGLPHPRAFGTHCRVLGRYVREEGLLSWGEAIHKMTGLPADILGLTDRGRLLPGSAADLVIFDPTTVGDRATYREPRQLSTGIRFVLVNGRVVLEEGALTGARPGRVLRRNQ